MDVTDSDLATYSTARCGVNALYFLILLSDISRLNIRNTLDFSYIAQRFQVSTVVTFFPAHQSIVLKVKFIISIASQFRIFHFIAQAKSQIFNCIIYVLKYV